MPVAIERSTSVRLNGTRAESQAVVEIAPGVEMTVDKRAITTQPVVDEFEYADDADDDAAEAVEAEVADADAAAEPAEAADEPAEAGAEKADATWDNPGTTKN